MIRTTISRIKRVWAVTFSPRILRGDLRYPPGKFQILTSTAPTTSLVRTKSNDSLYEDRKKRTKYGVADSHEEKDIFDDYMPQDMQTGTRHGAPKLYKTTSACRCDECNKVIAEIFGEEPAPSQDEDIKSRVLNNIAQVNMTDDTRCDKIVSDHRIHGGLFSNFNKSGSLPEMNKQKDDTDSITMTKDNYRSVLCHEVVLMNNRRGNKTDTIDMDTHQMYTNLYDVDPEDYQLGYSHDNSTPSHKKTKIQYKDAYWDEIYETAVGENSVYCEPTLSIDTDTLNTYRALKRGDTEVTDTSMAVRQMKYSPRELEKMLRETTRPAIETDTLGMIINAKKLDNIQLGRTNTGDLDEDQLTQKIEHIEETPLVEAEKSNVERSHDSPKVLGYAKKAVEPNSLDEVAKRCLTSHHNEIDEILLKEMEKLGIPLTVQKSTCGLKMGDVQADALNTELRNATPDMANKLDTRELGGTLPSFTETVQKSNNLEELKELEKKPLKLDNQYYFDLHRTRMVDDYKNKHQANNSEPTNKTNVGIVGNENQFRWLYWRAENVGQSGSKRSGTSEQENAPNFTDSIWQKNQLDPNHVLTCNETCSISPKPLTTTNEMNRIDGSNVMFHQQNVRSREFIREDPLLEDGDSTAYAIRREGNERHTQQRAITPDYINNSKAQDFKEFINSTNSTIMPNKQELVTHADYLNLVGMSHSEMTRDITKQNTADSEATVELSNDINNESISIEATNEQLQATSEQLQAASVQLKATCINLQTTTEKLQETTEQLQATSDNLLDSSDKLHAASGNLYTTSEKLQNTSEKLRDTSEQLGFDMQALLHKVSSYPTPTPKEHMWDMNEEADRADEMYLQYGKKAPSYNNTTAMNNPYINSATPIINTSITASMNPSGKPEIIPCVTPATASIITETVNSLYRMKGHPTETKQTEMKDIQENEAVRTDDEKQMNQEIPTKAIDPKIEGWTHQAAAVNPATITEELPQMQPLPELKDTVKLSELMRLVRERNRLVDCHEGAVLKKPQRKDILPMARPMANPPDIRVPGYPSLKPIPKICVPKGKPLTKSMKCSSCDTEKLGFDQQGPIIAQNDTEGATVLAEQAIDFTLMEEDYATNFTEELILQLHSLGDELESSFQRGKADILEAAVIAKTNHLAKIFRSNDYEPWSPIPSWPYPKKETRQKVQCPKDGCKIAPPRCEIDKPCGLKPCESFPTFPKRTFSLLDCYPVSLGDHKVVDVGQF